MKSKISCFDAGIARNLARRFWPLWAVYFAAMVVAFPLGLTSVNIYSYAQANARVLEYAMSGLGWIFDGGTQAPLREKLAYYAACIRDGFDTTGWPAVTAWEEPLQNTEYTAPAA